MSKRLCARGAKTDHYRRLQHVADTFRRHACVFMSEVYGQSVVTKNDRFSEGPSAVSKSCHNRPSGGPGEGLW